MGNTPAKTDLPAVAETVKNWLEKAKLEFDERWRETKPQSPVKLEDFDRLKTLGTGSFGRVMVVMHKASKDYYAMKILDKAKIIKLKQVEHTSNEKRVLYAAQFPFIENGAV
ncbi:unnamed protein product [Allacma fusca]|uniref:Protein kinase domain-containing protein n=1 Tax=Allacma fusca TaxID=39272 RepID=A0A8J2LL88_9HEXA|nr:unnamed protein product [Allacma fusca]